MSSISFKRNLQGAKVDEASYPRENKQNKKGPRQDSTATFDSLFFWVNTATFDSRINTGIKVHLTSCTR